MSQSLWDILEDRIADVNPSLLSRLDEHCITAEDRIDTLVGYANLGFGNTRAPGVQKQKPSAIANAVMPSCRKKVQETRRKINGNKGGLRERLTYIHHKYHFA